MWEGGEGEGVVGCGREGRGRCSWVWEREEGEGCSWVWEGGEGEGAVGCGREGRCGSAVMTEVPVTGQTALLPTSTHL